MTYEEYARNLFVEAPRAGSREWRIVMQFYAVVHATNSKLYRPGGAPLTHQHHEHAMQNDPTLSAWLVDYLELKRLSLDARYRPQVHPMTEADEQLSQRLAAAVLGACGVVV